MLELSVSLGIYCCDASLSISPLQESAPLLQLLLLLFSGQPLAALKERSIEGGVSEEDWKAFVAYAAAIFANLGECLPPLQHVCSCIFLIPAFVVSCPR